MTQTEGSPVPSGSRSHETQGELERAVEAVARALMQVRAPLPGSFGGPMSGRELPVLAGDPDYDDLPANDREGTDEDEITQEAVLKLARAALAALAEHLGTTPEQIMLLAEKPDAG